MTTVQGETGVLAGDERMLIDSELQHTASGATFDVIHPASEQVAGQATDGTVEDMTRAVGAARRAFDQSDWSRDVDFRFHCLTQLHDALERHKEHLRRVLITEVGCPVTVTGSQIESPIAEVKFWAEHGRDFDYMVDTGLHDTPATPSSSNLRSSHRGRAPSWGGSWPRRPTSRRASSTWWSATPTRSSSGWPPISRRSR